MISDDVSTGSSSEEGDDGLPCHGEFPREDRQGCNAESAADQHRGIKRRIVLAERRPGGTKNVDRLARSLPLQERGSAADDMEDDLDIGLVGPIGAERSAQQGVDPLRSSDVQELAGANGLCNTRRSESENEYPIPGRSHLPHRADLNHHQGRCPP